MAADAQRDLDEALPALEAATASLKNLSRNDVVEVKSLSNPPAGVKLVMEVSQHCSAPSCLLQPCELPEGMTQALIHCQHTDTGICITCAGQWHVFQPQLLCLAHDVAALPLLGLSVSCTWKRSGNVGASPCTDLACNASTHLKSIFTQDWLS